MNRLVQLADWMEFHRLLVVRLLWYPYATTLILGDAIVRGLCCLAFGVCIAAIMVLALWILAGCATPSKPDDGRNNDLFESMP